jgi:hypothetical protein
MQAPLETGFIIARLSAWPHCLAAARIALFLFGKLFSVFGISMGQKDAGAALVFQYALRYLRSLLGHP